VSNASRLETSQIEISLENTFSSLGNVRVFFFKYTASAATAIATFAQLVFFFKVYDGPTDELYSMSPTVTAALCCI
jgi:hypothetical protein